MKRSVITAALLLFALPAFSAPAWWTALHGQYLTEQEVAQVTFPQAPVSQPVATAVPVKAATASPAPASIPLTTNVTWFPKTIIGGGGGFSSPNGKFAVASESSYIGAGTYSTVAIEDVIVKGKIQSCTLAGITKPLYQLGPFTAGLTGLGGACQAPTGSADAAGSGQAFVDIRWGKLNWGNTIAVTKNTSDGWKVVLVFRWAQ